MEMESWSTLAFLFPNHKIICFEGKCVEWVCLSFNPTPGCPGVHAVRAEVDTDPLGQHLKSSYRDTAPWIDNFQILAFTEGEIGLTLVSLCNCFVGRNACLQGRQKTNMRDPSSSFYNLSSISIANCFFY